MADLPAHEYRLVCTGEGPGHRTHRYTKRDLAKATQAAIDANHHAEQHPTHMVYRACRPFMVERRLVGAWEKVEQEWT